MIWASPYQSIKMPKQTLLASPGDSSLELPAEGDVDEKVDAAVDNEAEVAGGQQHVQPVGELGTHCQGVLGGKAEEILKLTWN